VAPRATFERINAYYQTQVAFLEKVTTEYLKSRIKKFSACRWIFKKEHFENFGLSRAI